MEWLRVQLGASESALRFLEPGYGVNPAACLVSVATTFLVMAGIRESKVRESSALFARHPRFLLQPLRHVSLTPTMWLPQMVTDVFTWLKVFLVAFMTVGGFCLFDKSNFTPFIPPEFGASGVMRGAISSFFGYLGFDAGRLILALLKFNDVQDLHAV